MIHLSNPIIRMYGLENLLKSIFHQLENILLVAIYSNMLARSRGHSTISVL